MKRYGKLVALLAFGGALVSGALAAPDDSESSDGGGANGIEIDCAGFAYPYDSFTQSDDSKVYLTIDKLKPGVFKDANLTKYITVFGTKLIASAKVDDAKLLHIGNLLAQMLDADADGVVDKPAVQEALQERYSTLILATLDEQDDLLSSQDGVGLPEEIKYCPFSVDIEPSERIVIDGEPERNCPEDLFMKDRSLAFVSDHFIGRSWPMIFTTHDDTSGDDSEGLKKMTAIFEKAVKDGNFSLDNSGCPEDDSVTCGSVMLASWAATTLMGIDECFCKETGALKYCTRMTLEEQMPDLAELIKTHAFSGVTPDGQYTPSDSSVIVKDIVGDEM